MLASPVPIEEGFAQTLGAGLMEPLQAAPALQHFQIPPVEEHRTVASKYCLSLLTAPNSFCHLLPLPCSVPLTLFFLLHFSQSTNHINHSITCHPSLLTPQGHHSNSSSAVGCSDVQRPSPAPLVHMGEKASYPAWPWHRDPSSVHPPAAEKEQGGGLRGVGDEKLGRGCGWEAPTVRGNREMPLPWWQLQRHTGGRPRKCPLLLQGLGPWECGSPGDKLNNDNVYSTPLIVLNACVCLVLGWK